MENVKPLEPFLRPLAGPTMLVSPLGLGTVKFGRNQAVKNKVQDGFSLPSDASVRELLELALDLGINLIDTAPAYGTSEEVLGRTLGSLRDQFVLCTKVGEEFVDGVSSYDFSAAHTTTSVERSLARLRIDVLDCVLVHCPRNDLEVLRDSPVLETLAKLKEAGKIRAFGASTKSVAGGLYAAEHSDVVMLSFNLEYQAERPVIDRAIALGRGVLVIKALLQGYLDRIGGQDPATACFESVFSACPAATVVLGTINPDHLRQNAAAVTRVLHRSRRRAGEV